MGPRASPVLPSALRAAPNTNRLPLVVELPPGADARAANLVEIAPGFAAGDVEASQIEALASAHPEWRFLWAPPRRPLLDRAAGWIRLEPFRARTGGTGQRAVIGIVDTGIDLAHTDLRFADGRTRALWLIDFSRPAAGRHADLEERYGCTKESDDDHVTCAVFDQDDLDELLSNSILGDTPTDDFGHGTHVASLAAGNGLGSKTPRYIGIAPEAQLVVARVTRSGGAEIFDDDILVATKFIFERADELGLPAVVNLSLGSDFGAHDGSSGLERGLAAFIGPSVPGRAIVVAGGNSGGVFVGVAPSYPTPAGVHTEVHVSRSSSVRVPVLTAPNKDAKAEATVFIWISFDPADAVSVGVDRNDGSWIRPMPPRDGGTFHDGDLSVTIVNDDPGPGQPLPADGNSAIVVLDGKWDPGETFAVRLEGHGTAELWVQAEGALGPTSGTFGALFPRALKQGTINVPASHPALIAVGATLNRTDWTELFGRPVQMTRNGALDPSPLDSPAFFTAAGPTSSGLFKPDIVAPGMWVVGAMSNSADPRDHPGTMFSSDGDCGPGLRTRIAAPFWGNGPELPPVECFVVDTRHAVAMGTSMASPIVAGAVALLFEQDPGLTQPDMAKLLQAGARRLQGTVLVEQQAGPGALDVNGSLEALLAEREPVVRDPVAAESWIALANSYVRPDPNHPLVGLVELRAEGGLLADGFDPAKLRLTAQPASVRSSLSRVAPGLWRLEAAAPFDTGGLLMKLRLTFDDELLAERELPIGVDQAVADGGFTARGGCGVSAARSVSSLPLAVWLALAAAAFRRRHGSRRAK